MVLILDDNSFGEKKSICDCSLDLLKCLEQINKGKFFYVFKVFYAALLLYKSDSFLCPEERHFTFKEIVLQEKRAENLPFERIESKKKNLYCTTRVISF